MASMQPYKKWWRELLLTSLLLANILVWSLSYARASSDVLKVYFIDVGQGDAILIESPSKSRVLIDGGKNRQVVSELGRIIPFGDKRIDIVIATHPDADHIGGLPEVLSRYDVDIFMESGVQAETSFSNELERRLESEQTQTLVARRGQVINFGDGAKLTILFPDRDVSSWDTNDASVIARLDYGEASFLFTGDAGIKTENILINLDARILDADVLKAGHHGSRTSTSLTFAQTVSPEYAIISAGKNNSYGHPHPQVINILNQVGAEILSTAEVGTIKFETDGKILNTN